MGQAFSFKKLPFGRSKTFPQLSAPDSDVTAVSIVDDPRRQEPFSRITHEKKYFEFAHAPEPYPVFVKRSLTQDEYFIKPISKEPLVPYMAFERLKNEAASIHFIKKHTTIPVPNIRCAFEDHGRYYIITDIVPGVTMAELTEEEKATVIKELQGYINQMHSLRSKALGGVLGDVCIPFRLIQHVNPDVFHNLPEAETPEYVFCHNDLSQHNIIVDEETLKINAIIDWEYAGFFPTEFDSPFYLRKGPSVAIGDEVDDTDKLLEFFDALKAQI